MTITIDVNPQAQDWLQAEARRSGVDISRYVQRLIEGAAEQQSLTPGDDPTLALFARWDAEDATDDPEEIARRQRDGDDLLKSLRENPVSLRHIDIGEADAEDIAA